MIHCGLTLELIFFFVKKEIENQSEGKIISHLITLIFWKLSNVLSKAAFNGKTVNVKTLYLQTTSFLQFSVTLLLTHMTYPHTSLQHLRNLPHILSCAQKHDAALGMFFSNNFHPSDTDMRAFLFCWPRTSRPDFN